MKKFPILLLVFLLGGLSFAFGQSNALIDQYLEKEEADYFTSAYFVLSAAEIIPESATPEEAAARARQDPGVSVPENNRSISLGEFAHLIVESFEIPGGLMYGFFPGPRYAAREITYREFTLDKTAPGSKISGDDALRILGSALTWKEARP